MTVREYARTPRRTEDPRTEQEAPAPIAAEQRVDGDGLINDIDDLLDEIDAVLEEQSVLVNFRQRPGQ